LNTGTYANNNKFVPAETPVIIRSTTTSTTLALPHNKVEGTPLSCMFYGEYLEQRLSEINTGTDNNNNDVYTFGLPVDGVRKVAGYYSSGENNGDLVTVLPHTSDSGVGFYVNCNPNRERGGAKGEWIRNNRYVFNNKIYYRTSVSPSRQETRGIDFIPVVFDDDEEEDEPIEEGTQMRASDNRVYDLLGRCVVTEQEVKQGGWRERLRSGIYILNGKKFKK
jgi:hypothetical protein